MSLQHVRAESAVFLQDKQQKNRLFGANDVDGRRCLVTLKRLMQTPGHISLTCATLVHPVKDRPEDWVEEYAKLQQPDDGRYEVRDGYHHGGRIVFMLLSSVEDNRAAAESVVKKVDEFLYTLRGLDDYTREWYERFKREGYPTPEEVCQWLGPSGSVYA